MSLSIPTRIMNLQLICQQLGASLSAEDVISMVHNAMLNGYRQMIQYNGNTFLSVTYNQMKFIISSDCSTVMDVRYEQTAMWMSNQYSQYQSNQMCQSTTVRHETCPTVPTFQMPSVRLGSVKPCPEASGPQSDDTLLDDFDVEEMVNFIVKDNYIKEQSPASSVSSDSLRNGTAPLSKNRVSMMGSAPKLECIRSVEEMDYCQVIVPGDLYNELQLRFQGQLPSQWQSPALLAQFVQQIIFSLPMTPMEVQCGNGKLTWRVWSNSGYVYVLENDGYTLAGIFEERLFQQRYLDCVGILAQRHINGQTNGSNGFNSDSNTGSNLGSLPSFSGTPSYSTVYATASVSPTLTGTPEPSQSISSNPKHGQSYHLIYIKPIMERLTQVTGTNMDQDTVTNIVDRAIQSGEKRQISKRTFAFQWQKYTVIMSKSCRTILDVAIGKTTDEDVITVHPDVVSILAKKCPNLDYFKIQKLAEEAKQTARYSAKKNEYRQQFTYEYAGCRIVFASNHSTIVEMQCQDPSALSTSITL